MWVGVLQACQPHCYHWIKFTTTYLAILKASDAMFQFKPELVVLCTVQNLPWYCLVQGLWWKFWSSCSLKSKFSFCFRYRHLSFNVYAFLLLVCSPNFPMSLGVVLLPITSQGQPAWSGYRPEIKVFILLQISPFVF